MLLGCLAFLASPLLKRWVASSKPAHLVVSVAVVAVGVGVLIVARPAPAGERPNTVNVLVAVGPIGTGTTARDALDSGRIALQPIRLVDVRRDAIGNIKVIKDMVTVRRIRPGEQLTMQQFGASDGPATP
ncbi:MAG: hypothetical protein QOE01_674 [Actinomycetota bacterium]|nr:hypothetical protein [Actinomycetota bacterium]